MRTWFIAQICRVVALGGHAFRRVAAVPDAWSERLWEARRFFGHSLPSHGEMTAIVRRMGLGGFTEYALGQKLGYFGARSFLPTDRAQVVADINAGFPQEAATVIATAKEISSGIFRIFDSGAIDVRRGKWGGGHRIDWRLDPTSGNRYPLVFSHLRWNPYAMRPGKADIKGPWELARCQHFAALGQAYWLTGDERYARCFARTIDDFLRHNPVGLGIHWACPMEAALRAVGWLVGLSFFQGSKALSFRWWCRFLKGLAAHGRFIAANLEIGNIGTRLITGNHYTANLLGLYWISTCFPHLDAGNVWRALAERGLEREIRRQILADGGGFEASVPYHRLSVEMFLSAYTQSRHFGAPFSDGYRRQLLAALRFIKALRQPGGRWPQIGDADDGRAHILTGYGPWSREALDHLLAAGAHALSCPRLADDLPQEALVEQLFWGKPSPEIAHLLAIPNPAVFPDFGVAVVRGGRSYVSISNGPVGTDGFGNHKHNDQLAIEWIVDGQPLLVDGGSYAYTADPAARNWFRATAQHNTVIVDGAEQNTFEPGSLFRMNQQGTCGIEGFQPKDDQVGVNGFHSAYARLDPPVLHRRIVLVGKADGNVTMDDLLEGGSAHDLCWRFLIYPGVSTQIMKNVVELRGPKGAGRICAPSFITWQVEDGWYSPAYGRREPTVVLSFKPAQHLDRVQFLLIPDAGEVRDAPNAKDAGGA